MAVQRHNRRGFHEHTTGHEIEQVARDGREASRQQGKSGHAVGRNSGEERRGSALARRRVVERRPRILEGAEKELLREPEADAHGVNADFGNRPECRQDELVADGNDLLRGGMRHAWEPERQRLPQHVDREHGADERRETSYEYRHQRGRDDQVGNDDAQHAEPHADHECKARTQRSLPSAGWSEAEFR